MAREVSLLERWTYLLCAWLLLLRQVAALPNGRVLVGGRQGNGPTQLNGPMGISRAPDGDLIVADTDNNRVQKCSNYYQGFVMTGCTTIAGTGEAGYLPDMLRTPYSALPTKVEGNEFGLFISDTFNHRIQYWPFGRRNGRTIVGSPGVGAPNYQGPGELEFPAGLALDEAKGYLYVADTGHHRVVRYTLDFGGTRIIGNGVTVAGTMNVPGSNLSLLNNPTALYLDSDDDVLWVADARNKRVVRWIVSEAMLQREARTAASGGRRMAASEVNESESNSSENTTLDGNGSNETGDMTTATSTSTLTRTATHTSTTSGTATTTTTTYSGPRYELEMDGFKGRPYGIVRTIEGSLYMGDADGCVIWKKLTTGDTVAAAGGRCGAGTSQLQFPGNFLVSDDGVIIVADSSNNRVIRFGPEPIPVNIACQLGGYCETTMSGGNPTSFSRLAVIKIAFGSSCGGRCINSGLGGEDWVNIAPSEPPFLRTMHYKFGLASYGEVMQDYLLCFGSAGVESEVNAGNCTSVPYTAGRVRIFPFLQADTGSILTECVNGFPCSVQLSGYGIPDSIVVSAPPDSYPGSGIVCGKGSSSNFQGYTNFLTSNPGTTLQIDRPYEDTGNQTAFATVFFGVAIGKGGQRLCVCYEGNNCFAPTKFISNAGYMRVRSAEGGDRYYCQRGQNCSINVTGRFLKETDGAVLGDYRLKKCADLTMAEVSRQPFDIPMTNGSSGGTPFDAFVDDGLNYQVMDFGNVTEDGVFQVCYCASHDSGDNLTCNVLSEFSQSAGELTVIRITPEDFECPLGKNCTLNVSGMLMADTDMILVDATEGMDLCGRTVPQPATELAGIFFPANFFAAKANGSDMLQTFSLGSYSSPGRRQMCYCSSYDEDPLARFGSRLGTCNDPGEFFQPVGVLTIRGPRFQTLSCPANLPCNITVVGERLASDDLLQICPSSFTCGDSTVACATAGAKARRGLFNASAVTSAGMLFDLGSLPVGSYSLCYCAPGTGGTAEIPCAAPADLTMLAGNLRVRGVNGGQYFNCLQNEACEILVEGYDLSNTDRIIAVPLEGTCGVTEMVSELNVFNPNAMSDSVFGYVGTTTMKFRYAKVTTAERYKICYCMLETCENTRDFTDDAGVLLVKGIDIPAYSATCLLGATCNLELKGAGLQMNTDSVQVLPLSYGCGGPQLRVLGFNGSYERYNGLYIRQTGLFDERVWYQQQNGRILMFYDIFEGRWIIAPSRVTEVPNQPGWAIAVGDITTPELVPKGGWQVWVPSEDEGSWQVHPDLEVRSSIDANWSFGRNPSFMLSSSVADAVLGRPYLSGQTFDLGTAAAAGTYSLCWCPSLDLSREDALRGGDDDTQSCSSDTEYLMGAGALLVGYITKQGRFHCKLGAASCKVQLTVPTSVSATSRAVLLPIGVSCFKATRSMRSPWSTSRNISGRAQPPNQVAFEFGRPSVEGQFEICVCTNYDDGFDGVPCSTFSEFYEQAGALTVSSLVSLDFSAGLDAVLNLTAGSGLAATDQLLVVPGDACNLQSSHSLADAVTPAAMGDDGSWASWDLGPNGSSGITLSSGVYVACLCSGFDGADDDEEGCNRATEFDVKMARIQVSAVEGPELASSVQSTLFMRVNVSRRLAISDEAAASLTFTLSNALQTALTLAIEQALSATNLVTVLVTGVTPIRETAQQLTIAANFTAVWRSAATSQLKEVREIDNRTCPVELLEPPWGGQVQATADQELLLACLNLADALGGDAEQGQALAASVTEELSKAVIPGIIMPIEVTGLSTPKVPVLGFEPALYRCVRGASCRIRIFAAGLDDTPLPPAGSLLMIAGQASCGATSQEATDAKKNSRAASGFSTGNPVDASSPMTSSVRTVDLGESGEVGTYTLCYCAGSDSGGGVCALDRDYFSTVGSLRVRGPPSNIEAYCVVNRQCNVSVEGTDLSIWDWLLVKDGDDCFASGATSLNASEQFSINPAGLPNEDAFGARHFDVGVAAKLGTYSLCYCASYTAAPGSSARPCSSPADYTMQVGTLFVRGVQSSAFRFGCVKAMKGDGEAPCSLYVTGLGLMPVQDKMIVIPYENTTCGQVKASAAFGFSPNPIELALPDGEEVVPWGVVRASLAARWNVKRAENPGKYRVCYCPDSPDGSMDSRGDCFTSEAGYYHEVGQLGVRGANGGQLFMCYPGGDCEVTIEGIGLTSRDKVRIVGPEDSCSLMTPSWDIVELSPTGIEEVAENGTYARFKLGKIRDFSPRVPVALRVCYCANFNEDLEGVACTNSSDFTHTGGTLNIAVCPDPPASDVYIPPVQDVIGDPGNPALKFYAVPSWTCIDVDSRTPEDLLNYTKVLPLGEGGYAGQGGRVFEESVVLSSGLEQCSPGINADTPRIFSVNWSIIDLSIVGGRDGFSVARNGIPMDAGFKVRGKSSLADLSDHAHECAAWQVEVMPVACGWDATMLFGGLLHLLLLISAVCCCCSMRAFDVLRFMGCIHILDRVAKSVQEGQGEEKKKVKKKGPYAPKPPEEKTTEGGLQTEPEEPDSDAVQVAVKIELENRTGIRDESLVQQAVSIQDDKLLWLTKKALGGGGIEGAQREDVAMRILASRRVSITLLLLRAVMFGGNVFLLIDAQGVGDAVLLFVVPFGLTFLTWLIQELLLAMAWGWNKMRYSLKRPQYILHSCTLNLKLHLDLAVPTLLQRHHCELWRVAIVLVALEMIIHVAGPLLNMCISLLPKRRVVPEAVLWLATNVLKTPPHKQPGLLKPAKMQADLETRQRILAERYLAIASAEDEAKANPKILRKAETGADLGFHGRVPEGHSTSPKGKISLDSVASDIVTVGAFVPAPKKSPTRLRGGLRINDKETRRQERAITQQLATKDKEQKEMVQGVLRMQALEEMVNMPPSEPRCKLGHLTWILAQPIVWLMQSILWGQWAVMALLATMELEHPEEYRRRRITSLWSFLDTSGLFVASVQFRKQAESAGGFELPRIEDRWTLGSTLLAGLDLAVLSLFLVWVYLPRLSYTEMAALLLGVFCTILQVGRPGIFKAAMAAADDFLDRPQSLCQWMLCLVVIRVATMLPSWMGCARSSWTGYMLWNASVVFLEGPAFLFCWRSWPVLEKIITGKKAPWPRDICRMLWNAVELFIPSYIQEHFQQKTPWVVVEQGQDAPVATGPPTVPMGSRQAGTFRLVHGIQVPPSIPSLREAAQKVVHLRKQEDAEPREATYPEAEPCLHELFALVEEIGYAVTKEMRVKIVDDRHSQIAKLHHLFFELHRTPPDKYALTKRLHRLEKAEVCVDKLEEICKYLNPTARTIFSDLRTATLNELYAHRMMVKSDRLMRSMHWRHGSLLSRAQVVEAVLPSAPRFWLVGYDTLEDLGRLPKPLEFEKLTLAQHAHEVHGKLAVVIAAIHRWRSLEDPDPHRVTWRQLVTFARWYRWRWGPQYHVYFWIDYSCMPEQKAYAPPPKPPTIDDPFADSDDDSDEDEDDLFQRAQSAASNNSSKSSKGSSPGRARGMSWSSDSEASSTTTTSSKRKNRMAKHLAKKGLGSLAAWAEENDEQLQREDEEKALAMMPKELQIDFSYVTDGRAEPCDVQGQDALLPLIFAASDGVLICSSHTLFDCSWCRLYMSLAYAFAPFGRLMYEVDRDLVHVTKHQRRDWERRIAAMRSSPGLRRVAGLSFEEGNDESFDQELPHALMDQSQDAEPAQLTDGNPDEGGGVGESFFNTSGISEVTREPNESFTGEPGFTGGSTGLHVEDFFQRTAKGGTNFNTADDFAENCMDRFLAEAKAHTFEMPLLDPTDWENLLIHNGGDRERILRLNSYAMDVPMQLTDTAHRRVPLRYGTFGVRAVVTSLEGRKRMTRRRGGVIKDLDEESSSDSEVEPEQVEAPPESFQEPEPPPLHTFNNGRANWDEHMTELYFGQNEMLRYAAKDTADKQVTKMFSHVARIPEWQEHTKKKKGARELVEERWLVKKFEDPDPLRRTNRRGLPSDVLLQQIKDDALGTSAQNFWSASSSTLKRSLQPLPPKKDFAAGRGCILRFHQKFVGKSVVLGEMGKTAEKLGKQSTHLPVVSLDSGGLVMLSKPLSIRPGVAPDEKNASGVTFDITIEETDTNFRDGLGIGFSAQDPDAWPSHRKGFPKTALQMPRTCMVGYSGVWYQEGHSELNKGAWQPGKLKKGDVVTAALAAHPANVMRVLVNGKVVAQRSADSTGLPDPSRVPIWGIVDVESACVKIRLGNQLPPSSTEDDAELAELAVAGF